MSYTFLMPRTYHVKSVEDMERAYHDHMFRTLTEQVDRASLDDEDEFVGMYEQEGIESVKDINFPVVVTFLSDLQYTENSPAVFHEQIRTAKTNIARCLREHLLQGE